MDHVESELSDSVILDQHQLRALIPYSLAQIARLEAQGLFPKRLHLGPSRIGWLAREIAAWVEERAAERDLGN